MSRTHLNSLKQGIIHHKFVTNFGCILAWILIAIDYLISFFFNQKEEKQFSYNKTTMTDNYSRIKTELLKSGLPLESMVADTITATSQKLPRQLLNIGEYFFERKESELPHSIDFQVIYDLDVPNCDFLEIAFLIECKYRTKGTGWYFVQNYLKDAGQEFFVENFFSKAKCNTKNFPVFVPPLNNLKIPVAGKGVEIYGNGHDNEKSIMEGIHQLMFACCSSLSRAFFKEETMRKAMMDRKIDITNRSWHSLLCPILVTNADLYYLSNPAINDVEHSEKIEDIAIRNNLIALSTPFPPLYVRKYIQENVFSNIETMLINPVDKTKAKIYLMNTSALNPSRYYIISHNNLGEFIKEYIDFASSMLSYASKRT